MADARKLNPANIGLRRILPICAVCFHQVAAPGSKFCVACERKVLDTSIDLAARGKLYEPMLYKTARKEIQKATFWTLFFNFSLIVMVLVILWRLFQ